MTTALVDYDSGNLHSAQKAFERMATEVGAGPIIVTGDPDVVARADRIVLPESDRFECTAAYYATLFHEMTHSTGHPKRLGRFSADSTAAFGASTSSSSVSRT